MAEPVNSLFEITQLIKSAIHRELGEPFWITAEILELHVNRSGHCYLELIEKNAEGEGIRAKAQGTIWANQFRMLKAYFETTAGISLETGIKILFKATVEFHELYGLSLNITDIDPSYTLGDLALKKQEVIRRLAREGVINMNREIPLPVVMQKIAVISSNTAAGYGDFMETLENNSFGYVFNALLFPAILQGEQAVPSIIQALDSIYERETEFDCVVLIRGGGSQSDLACFNRYELAYHITQFPLPVLTGIGHERDESVADMVSAKPLKTPTAVAEFLVDKMLSFEMMLNGLSERVRTAAGHHARENLLRLNQLGTTLANLCSHRIQLELDKLNYTQKSFTREVKMMLEKENERIRAYEKILELVHPETLLARGYSITRYAGKAIKTIRDIREGQKIETIIRDGIILSSVEEFKKENIKRRKIK